MSRKTAWLTIPVYVAVLALIVWWWWRETERRTEPAAGLMGGRPKPPGPPARRTTAPPRPISELPAAKDDDLKVVEGIGPKIESVLKAAGILSYARLADTAPDRLGEILADAGVRIGFPATWPEQAALAAAGDWQGLERLQSQLKGGRRAA